MRLAFFLDRKRVDLHLKNDLDVIATTKDGKRYLIEFTFEHKVQHKKAIDYKNLTCLEVDLSNQTLETVKEFLLKSNKDRRWLNNEYYFECVESLYRSHGRNVRLVEESECSNCELCHRCCGVKKNANDSAPITIGNSGRRYRLCKPEVYAEMLEALKKERLEEKKRIAALNTPSIDPSERTCFMCVSNLAWKNIKETGYANCGSYMSIGVPKKTPPETARWCRGFKRK